MAPISSFRKIASRARRRIAVLTIPDGPASPTQVRPKLEGRRTEISLMGSPGSGGRQSPIPDGLGGLMLAFLGTSKGKKKRP
jgi:hypothetical protein